MANTTPLRLAQIDRAEQIAGYLLLTRAFFHLPEEASDASRNALLDVRSELAADMDHATYRVASDVADVMMIATRYTYYRAGRRVLEAGHATR